MPSFGRIYIVTDRQTDGRTDGKSNYISPTGRSNNCILEKDGIYYIPSFSTIQYHLYHYILYNGLNQLQLVINKKYLGYIGITWYK